MDRIVEDGTVRFSLTEVVIEECPQRDQRAATLIDLALERDLPLPALIHLGVAWRPAFERCDHPSLEDWYLASLHRLAVSNPSAVSLLLAMFPKDLTPSIRTALRREAATPSLPDFTKGTLLARAVSGLPEDVRVRTSLEIIGAGEGPSWWAANETNLLLASDARAFLVALERSAGAIPPEPLAVITRVIGAHLRNGGLRQHAATIDALRVRLRSIEGVAAVVEDWPESGIARPGRSLHVSP